MLDKEKFKLNTRVTLSSIPKTLNCYLPLKSVISQSITLLSPSHAQTSGTLQSVWAGPPQWIRSACICINSKWKLTNNMLTDIHAKKNHLSFKHTQWNSFILINPINSWYKWGRLLVTKVNKFRRINVMPLGHPVSTLYRHAKAKENSKTRPFSQLDTSFL